MLHHASGSLEMREHDHRKALQLCALGEVSTSLTLVRDVTQAGDTGWDVAVEEHNIVRAVGDVEEAIGQEEAPPCTLLLPLAPQQLVQAWPHDEGGEGARHVVVDAALRAALVHLEGGEPQVLFVVDALDHL